LENLRNFIRQILNETKYAQHRCLDGSLVDHDSIECLIDVEKRLKDMLYHRDGYDRGTANRVHYNGLLSNLRSKRRKLLKKYPDYETIIWYY